MNNTNIFDKDLNPVLEIASNDDLEPLVGYLKTKLSEDLTQSAPFKTHSPNHTQYADLIAKEIRDMGGNSFVNTFRGEGPSYHEIAYDVASKLGVSIKKSRPIADIEDSILESILQTALEKMTDAEKEALSKELGENSKINKGHISTAVFLAAFKAGGFASYKVTVIIAHQIAKLILGRGLQFGASQAITRTAAVLTGPIGWAITGIWTAIDLAGPAYKVTIPCVIHVAMLRKKLESLHCECGAILPDSTMKFCPECGNSLVK